MSLLAAVVLAQALAQAPDTGPGLDDLFRAGVEAYDAQEFDRAIEAWEKVRRYRVESPVVEYNLGNAYYRKRDLGRAVLHWERALVLEPGDADAARNLEVVRLELVDDVRRETSPLDEALAWVGRAARPEESALVAFGAWQIAGLAAFVALVGPARTRRAALALLASAGVVLALALPAYLLQSRAVSPGLAVVVSPVVEVRAGPGPQYTTVFTVHEGLVLDAAESASGWRRVRVPGGPEGWIPEGALEAIASER